METELTKLTNLVVEAHFNLSNPETDNSHVQKASRAIRDAVKLVPAVLYEEEVAGQILSDTMTKVDKLDEKCENALAEAISAIYFADNSDYLSYLWCVVSAINDDAAQLLEDDEDEAYRKYVCDEDVAP